MRTRYVAWRDLRDQHRERQVPPTDDPPVAWASWSDHMAADMGITRDEVARLTAAMIALAATLDPGIRAEQSRRHRAYRRRTLARKRRRRT